jgi:uncharacterized membrane protein YfhO
MESIPINADVVLTWALILLALLPLWKWLFEKIFKRPFLRPSIEPNPILCLARFFAAYIVAVFIAAFLLHLARTLGIYSTIETITLAPLHKLREVLLPPIY